MSAPASPTVPTAALADAALRLGVAVRPVPPTLSRLQPGPPVAGRAVPVTHLGSVDAILEAIDDAAPGDVLVVDNGGRDDEACVGDLLVLEAASAGLAAVVVGGRHRDDAQLRGIGFPLWSRGPFPFGPRRTPPPGRAMRSATLGGVLVSSDDTVFADDDGVLVVATADVEAIVAAAAAIVATETAQADRVRAGDPLREQLDFAGYRRRQAADPTLTLRRHLAERGGAIEV